MGIAALQRAKYQTRKHLLTLISNMLNVLNPDRPQLSIQRKIEKRKRSQVHF